LKEFSEGRLDSVAPKVRAREREKRRRLWCLTLGDAKLEHGGQIDYVGHAKRKARKRAVTDIDDSVKQKPAVNGVAFT
jgi:hypothetical protein